MIWGVLALVLLVALILVSAVTREATRVLPVAAVAVVGVIAFFAWYQDRELKASKQRIALDDVELVDVRLMEDQRGPKELLGRIRNRSEQYTLYETVIQAVMQDCVEQRCDIVDQTEVTVSDEIPPGQSRDFRERVYFRSLIKTRGERVLQYDVIETRAR